MCVMQMTLKYFAENADAVKMFEATKLWLKDRLGLEISPEKSKIVNLKRHYSDFLGFKLKVREKARAKTASLNTLEAHIQDKKLVKIKAYSKEIIVRYDRPITRNGVQADTNV